MKLLLIEDDPSDALFVRRCIDRSTKLRKSSEPCSLAHAACLADALGAMEQDKFDAVLLDLNLPDSSGEESVVQLLKVDPELPIVVLSGENSEDVAIRMLNQGVQDYLVKWDDDGKTILRSLRYAAERKRSELRLAYLANHDTLTGLYSRRYFLDYLPRAQSRTQRLGTNLALLFLDLDRFKSINDMMGHHFGDQVLQAAVQRILGVIRNGDLVARMGGDEFCILLENVQDIDTVRAVARKLLTALRQPFELQGLSVVLSASIGITIFPQEQEDAAGMLRNADIAMHEAKAQGRNDFKVFSDEMHAAIVSRHKLQQDIHRALRNEEFFLTYQPQYNLCTHKLVGAEALARWRLPDGSVAGPDKFIQVAEDSGQIIEIGYQLLQKACLQNIEWQHQTGRPARLSVNVSPQQIHQANFYERLRRIFNQCGVDPSHIELEITESCLLEDDQFASQRLNKLKDLGVTIAIDDFGTGHSCLSYLHRFPIDVLKIDRSFVKDIGTNPHGTTICRAIKSIAQDLGMSVVAEGIETDEQLRFLQDLGCEVGQGYLFSPPINVESPFPNFVPASPQTRDALSQGKRDVII